MHHVITNPPFQYLEARLTASPLTRTSTPPSPERSADSTRRIALCTRLAPAVDLSIGCEATIPICLRNLIHHTNGVLGAAANSGTPSSSAGTGHSGPFVDNTGKLELPSISQVHTRSPVDIAWYNHHAAQRPLLSSDRLPNLQLPQTYPPSTSSVTSSSRIGSLDSSSNYSSNPYPPSVTSVSSYPSINHGIALKTPSPSPAPQTASSQPHGHSEDTGPHPQYHSQPQSSYGQDPESYGGAMNANQQYTDSQHSHLSGGPPYTPQSQTSGGMAHYPQYQQQAPPLQPIHGSYAPSPSYGQYGYATGVTSPQNAGQPVAAPQMNSQQHPLPGKKFS